MFCFLHHLAFLRHIKVLTFQADRSDEEQPAVTHKAQKQLTSRVIALMMNLHPNYVFILEANFILYTERETLEVTVWTEG